MEREITEKEMFLYEFITPSDAITFKAENDQVALAAAIMAGEGKAGCHKQDGINLNSLLMFASDPMAILKQELGMEFTEFLDKNKEAVKAALLSFAYADFSERQTYEDALTAITDDKARETFKKKHEERNRSSMSKWVQYAWQIADRM